MNAITGTYKNGQIILDKEADWPEGCRVTVEPAVEEETLGIREEDWPETPEAIAAHLALMDQIEPLEMTAEEEVEWQAARQAQKEFEKAAFNEHAEKLRKMWE